MAGAEIKIKADEGRHSGTALTFSIFYFNIGSYMFDLMRFNGNHISRVRQEDRQ